MHVRSLLGLLALFALAVSLSGCGALRAAAAKQQHINEAMKNYTYDKSLAEVWPEARTMLFESNHQVRDTGEAGGNTLETEWARDNSGNMTRYLVQGLEVDGKAQIRFNAQARTQSGQTSGGRDYGMEWQLVQRVEPERAAKIEADASTAGNAARGD